MAAVGKRQKLRKFRSLRSADLNAWCGMAVMTMLAVNGRFALRVTSSSHLQRKSEIRRPCRLPSRPQRELSTRGEWRKGPAKLSHASLARLLLFLVDNRET